MTNSPQQQPSQQSSQQQQHNVQLPLVLKLENDEMIIVENVRDFISEAVGLAHQAVQFDNNNEKTSSSSSSSVNISAEENAIKPTDQNSPATTMTQNNGSESSGGGGGGGGIYETMEQFKRHKMELTKAKRLYLECAMRLDAIRPHLSAEHGTNLSKFVCVNWHALGENCAIL